MTGDAAGHVYDPGDVLIEDDRIAWVGPAGEAPAREPGPGIEAAISSVIAVGRLEEVAACAAADQTHLTEMPNNGLNVPQGGRRVFPPHLNAASLEFEELNDFLMSDRVPEGCMQLSDLDGFLTALAIGPELIMPSEWLPVIWGEGGPEFESAEEAKGVIGAIMARYNEILHLIQHRPDDYEPLFWQTPDGEPVAGDWAEGFMAGVALRGSAWQPLVESEEDGGLLAPIIAFLHDEEGNSLVQGETNQVAEVQRIAIELIAPSVQAISNYWRAHRPPPRRASKTGRNEPCPCGSGRKYKRCCGANQGTVPAGLKPRH